MLVRFAYAIVVVAHHVASSNGNRLVFPPHGDKNVDEFGCTEKMPIGPNIGILSVWPTQTHVLFVVQHVIVMQDFVQREHVCHDQFKRHVPSVLVVFLHFRPTCLTCSTSKVSIMPDIQ